MGRRDRDQGGAGLILDVRVVARPGWGEHATTGAYVRTFWAAELGPLATALLQFLASRGSARLDMVDLAGRLGVGHKAGPDSALNRAIDRLVDFRVCEWSPDDDLLVPDALPSLPERRVAKLPESLQAEHDAWPTTR